MKVPYDSYYEDLDYFGKAYKGLVEFFSAYLPKGHVLDLGCGQGRDLLAIAQLGYETTGVDISQVGIDQMLEVSNKKGLGIQGLVADVYTFQIEDWVDIVLLDSMLHFYKNDQEKEQAFVERILESLKPGGLLVNCIIEGKNGQAKFKEIIDNTRWKLEIVEETYVDYPEGNCRYNMMVIKKLA